MIKKFLLLLCLVWISTSIKAQLLVSSGDEGYYYDANGTKVTGFIKTDNGYIFFKNTKRDPVSKKIAAADIKGYVIGTDSFTVSRNAAFKTPVFLNVAINNATRLYFFDADKKVTIANTAGGITVTPGSGKSKHYLYGTGPDDLQLLTAENFIEVMSKIMADKPEIVERVKDKTIHIKNVKEWVVFYLQEKGLLPRETPVK